GTVTDQGGVGGDPVTAQGRDVARRLDEVGLALAVAAQEGGDPRGEGQLGGAVAAEVRDAEVTQVHAWDAGSARGAGVGVAHRAGTAGRPGSLTGGTGAGGGTRLVGGALAPLGPTVAATVGAGAPLGVVVLGLGPLVDLLLPRGQPLLDGHHAVAAELAAQRRDGLHGGGVLLA